MLEVIIKIGKGSKYFPKKISARLIQGAGYPYSRMNTVVDIFKEDGNKNTIKLKDIKIENMEEDVIYRELGSEYYYVRVPGKNEVAIYELVNVREDIPWKISYSKEYGEYIKYAKGSNYEIAIKELNYCV